MIVVGCSAAVRVVAVLAGYGGAGGMDVACGDYHVVLSVLVVLDRAVPYTGSWSFGAVLYPAAQGTAELPYCCKHSVLGSTLTGITLS